MTQRVAFIGLGIMGSRMAANLLQKGDLSLTVYNRSPEASNPLARQGATVAESVADAVRDADVVFSMLASPAVVEQLALGDGGFVDAMATDALWVDCSTVNPSFTRRMAGEVRARGVRFVEAPVAGTREPAATGELTFIVGGAKTDYQAVEPLLQTMGKKILHVGDTGQGSAFKMLVNAMLAQSMLAFAETSLLGEKMGFSRDFLMDTLPQLPVSAPFLGGKAELIRKGEFEAQFPLELMHKDLHLLDQTAYEAGQPLYLANLAKEVYATANSGGWSRQDFAAVFDFLNRDNG